jgi:hypothetical protein
MNSLDSFEILFDVRVLEILVLTLSVFILIVIQLINNRNVEKFQKGLSHEITELKKYAEVQASYLNQFEGHFGQIDNKIKNIDTIVTVTSRDISTMADGITGEVGVGKAIELARRGASIEEILKNSNLKEDQAELIVKFHGRSSDEK